MKNKKTVILAVLLWIPLSVVTFIHSDKNSMLMRIFMSVAAGPVLFFMAGLAALAASALMLGSFYVFTKLGWNEANALDNMQSVWGHFFVGCFGVAIVVLYYFTITNQSLFLKLYGGW